MEGAGVNWGGGVQVRGRIAVCGLVQSWSSLYLTGQRYTSKCNFPLFLCLLDKDSPKSDLPFFLSWQKVQTQSIIFVLFPHPTPHPTSSRLLPPLRCFSIWQMAQSDVFTCLSSHLHHSTWHIRYNLNCNFILAHSWFLFFLFLSLGFSSSFWDLHFGDVRCRWSCKHSTFLPYWTALYPYKNFMVWNKILFPLAKSD